MFGRCRPEPMAGKPRRARIAEVGLRRTTERQTPTTPHQFDHRGILCHCYVFYMFQSDQLGRRINVVRDATWALPGGCTQDIAFLSHSPVPAR